jgi:hypothetical protein
MLVLMDAGCRLSILRFHRIDTTNVVIDKGIQINFFRGTISLIITKLSGARLKTPFISLSSRTCPTRETKSSL